jgi:hypothetical protein
LEASGLALFNAVATPETELYGEKIVRVTIPQPSQSRHSSNNNDDGHKLRDKFKRGDVLVMTPQMQFKGRDVHMRRDVQVQSVRRRPHPRVLHVRNSSLLLKM